MSRNLVITRAGPNSLHPRWLQGARDFDLLVARYDGEPSPRCDAGISEVYIPGPKVAGWRALFERRSDLIQNYDRIALIDDDIDTDASSLTRCFELGERFGLAVWQPSLSWNSYATYAATLHNPVFAVRFVNCIEMMCPFFTVQALTDVVPIFALGLESGIDLVWCSLSDGDPKRHAILDAVTVRHTRPVGVEKAKNGFSGRAYESDIERCLTLFATRWPSQIAYEAVNRAGGVAHSQFAIGLAATVLIGAVFAAPPGNRRYRLNAVLDHIRHQLTRRPLYVAEAKSQLARILALTAEVRAL